MRPGKERCWPAGENDRRAGNVGSREVTRKRSREHGNSDVMQEERCRSDGAKRTRGNEKEGNNAVVSRAESDTVDALLEMDRGTEHAGNVVVECGVPLTLPSFEEVESCKHMYVGPTDESNWVIPGKLLVGAYPSELDNQAHERQLLSILNCGVSTFVCLQSEYDHYCNNREAWASGKAIRPYIHDARRILEQNSDASHSNSKMVASSKLEFLYLSIQDCNITGDEEVGRLARALCWRLLEGEVVYVHCWGGHGRTGTLVSLVLGLLYKVSKAEALKRTQLYHDLRSCPLHVPSPQTFPQRMQVLRILEAFESEPSILEQYRAKQAPYKGEEFMLPIDSKMAKEDCIAFRAEDLGAAPRGIRSPSLEGLSSPEPAQIEPAESVPFSLVKRKSLDVPGSAVPRPLKPPGCCDAETGTPDQVDLL